MDAASCARLQASCRGRAVLSARAPDSVEQLERLLDLEVPSLLVLRSNFGGPVGELLRRIKAPPHRALLPVLAVVPGDADRIQAWRAAGDLAVLAKSGDGELAAALDGLLARHDLLQQCVDRWPGSWLLRPGAFAQRVEEEIRFVRRYGAPGSVGLLRVHGHAAPACTDTVDPLPLTLRWAADIARARLREVETFGVTDDGSLGILLPATPLAGGIVAMRRVVDGVTSAVTRDLDGAALLVPAAAVTSYGSEGAGRLLERLRVAVAAADGAAVSTLAVV